MYASPNLSLNALLLLGLNSAHERSKSQAVWQQSANKRNVFPIAKSISITSCLRPMSKVKQAQQALIQPSAAPLHAVFAGSPRGTSCGLKRSEGSSPAGAKIESADGSHHIAPIKAFLDSFLSLLFVWSFGEGKQNHFQTIPVCFA